MNGPTQKPPPTLADYKAAEARLREVRDEAAVRVAESQERGDLAAGNEWATRLKDEFDNFKAFREGLPRDVLLSIHADRILESFSIDKENFVNLTIPADVSDEDAMHALNARFREVCPDKKRAAICEEHIEQILDAGNGSGRRARGARVIKLLAVVPRTTAKTRDQQAEVLKQKGLTFPHPIEQALAAAAYACKRSGEDLFKTKFVCGSVPGFVLGADRFVDVGVLRFIHDCGSVVAASGSSSAPRPEPRGKPELKNLDRLSL